MPRNSVIGGCNGGGQDERRRGDSGDLVGRALATTIQALLADRGGIAARLRGGGVVVWGGGVRGGGGGGLFLLRRLQLEGEGW